MIDNEQWESDGNCNICRRRSYCKKNCSAFHRGIKRAVIGRMFENTAFAAMTIEALANNHDGYFKKEAKECESKQKQEKLK